MTSVKDPRKLARKVFREYGGRVHIADKWGTHYIFPDGSTVLLGDNDHHGIVIEKVETVRARFGGLPGQQFGRLGTRPHKPSLDFDRLVASDHAKERLRLMQRQAAVSFAEVLLTLRTPERVLWSDKHESWLWVRDRIAVAVKDTGQQLVIATVLWTTHDLWEANPRPA